MGDHGFLSGEVNRDVSYTLEAGKGVVDAADAAATRHASDREKRGLGVVVSRWICHLESWVGTTPRTECRLPPYRDLGGGPGDPAPRTGGRERAGFSLLTQFMEPIHRGILVGAEVEGAAVESNAPLTRGLQALAGGASLARDSPDLLGSRLPLASEGGSSRTRVVQQIEIGRAERIRTSDHLVPNQVRYQTALRPDARQPNQSVAAREGTSRLVSTRDHRSWIWRSATLARAAIWRSA